MEDARKAFDACLRGVKDMNGAQKCADKAQKKMEKMCQQCQPECEQFRQQAEQTINDRFGHDHKH